MGLQSLHPATPPTFVISTGAKRSGEICGFPSVFGASRNSESRFPSGMTERKAKSDQEGRNVAWDCKAYIQPLHLPLSSRPERSAVERSAVFLLYSERPIPFGNDRKKSKVRPGGQKCGMGLQSLHPATPPTFVISTGAKRSGEICGFPSVFGASGIAKADSLRE